MLPAWRRRVPKRQPVCLLLGKIGLVNRRQSGANRSEVRVIVEAERTGIEPGGELGDHRALGLAHTAIDTRIPRPYVGHPIAVLEEPGAESVREVRPPAADSQGVVLLRRVVPPALDEPS